jgi:hypothetical protein
MDLHLWLPRTTRQDINSPQTAVTVSGFRFSCRPLGQESVPMLSRRSAGVRWDIVGNWGHGFAPGMVHDLDGSHPERTNLKAAEAALPASYVTVGLPACGGEDAETGP